MGGTSNPIAIEGMLSHDVERSAKTHDGKCEK